MRNDYIDYLKGILILLVVLGHSIQCIVYKDSEAFFDNPVVKFIYIFHMPLFMSLSGFVSCRSINNKSLTKVIGVRFKQLIIPIICWSVLYNSALLSVFITNSDSMKHAFLTYSKSIIFDMNSRLWFLWSLFYSFSVVSLLKAVKMDKPAVFLMLTALFLLIPDVHTATMFKYTFPFFCLGYYVSKMDKIVFPLSPSSFTFFICSLASLIIFMFWDNDTYIYISRMRLSSDNMFNILFMYIGGIIVSMGFLVFTSIIYKAARSRMLSALGKYTLAIYILQTYFFVFVLKIVPDFEYPVLLSFVAAPLLTVLLSIIFFFMAKWISRYSMPGMLFFGKVRN